MYLVTGATGNVGSRVVSELLSNHVAVRVLTRDPKKVEALGNDVEVAIGSFQEHAAITAALQGVSHLFLMNRGLTDDTLDDLLQIAGARGCQRIVFLSSVVANFPDSMLGRLHLQQEERILRSSVGSRVFRATALMTNAFQWIDSIKNEGVVRNWMGDGLYAPIAPDDVAKFAVHLLMDNEVSERRYLIAGPELLTIADQVSILSEALGNPIKCVDLSPEKVREDIIRVGTPQPLVAAVEEVWGLLRRGAEAKLLDTFQASVGVPPRTFETWVDDNRARFL